MKAKLMRVTVRRRDDVEVEAENPEARFNVFAHRSDVTLVKTFGRGRFASIETTETGLDVLRSELGDAFHFVRTPSAKAFQAV